MAKAKPPTKRAQTLARFPDLPEDLALALGRALTRGEKLDADGEPTHRYVISRRLASAHVWCQHYGVAPGTAVVVVAKDTWAACSHGLSPYHHSKHWHTIARADGEPFPSGYRLLPAPDEIFAGQPFAQVKKPTKRKQKEAA